MFALKVQNGPHNAWHIHRHGSFQHSNVREFIINIEPTRNPVQFSLAYNLPGQPSNKEIKQVSRYQF